MALESVNPATGERLQSFPEWTAPELEATVDAAHQAWLTWRTTPFDTRAACLRKAATLLRARKAEYARTIASEMGKPVSQGEGEIEKCAWVCEHFAQHAPAMLADEPVPTDARESFVTYQPLGVILTVMPWNFPFWQVFRAAAPALMAGNALVLKHASNVPQCALHLERVFSEAGLPANLFRTLLAGSPAVGPLIAHPRVRAVTLTGSTEAGRAVAAQAGAALKKTVLELGGSDPYVILADADLAAAAKTCAHARMLNGGQSCIAAKRFIVVDAVRRDFEDALRTELARYVPADPLDPATNLGPLARRDLRDALHGQVARSVAQGARLALGGVIPPTPGAWYPATLLTDVRPGMPAADEETFGPVAAVLPAKDETEALRLAHATPFGLGAALFTNDLPRARSLARDCLDAGSCFINTFVRSDPRLPFGGVRDSGYGRELGLWGLREFVNIKTVFTA